MAQISVMVLLNNVTYLLAKASKLPMSEVDQVRQLKSKLEYVLNFIVNSKGTINRYEDDGPRKLVIYKELVDEIGGLVHEAEGCVGTIDPPALDMNPLQIHVEEIINRICRDFGVGYEPQSSVSVYDPIQAPFGRGLSRRMCPLPVEDDEAVGLSESHELLVDRLINKYELWSEYGDASKLKAIAITGEGGTGKSTLANNLYNNVRVTRHFTSRAWISVSTKYRLRNLLLSILNHVMVINQETYDMDEWQLKKQILQQLEHRRYFIVMDDVWTAEAWDEIEDVFPDNKLGSRVLVTTRSDDVAARVLKAPRSSWRFFYDYYWLGSLSSDDSWVLFCKVIFGGKKCPETLRSIGRDIVDKCGGRPIVIVVVASILRAREKTLDRWRLLVDRLRWYSLRKYRDNVFGILSICYEEIPQHLRTCFLYLSVFPEDFEISVKQLIQLWIAEGLIPWVENATPAESMEDLAQGYLKELVSLKLVEVTKKRSNGDPKSIRIHDFIRELCISLSRDEKFVEVYGHSGRTTLRRPDDEVLGSRSRDHSTRSKPWVLSILSNCGDYIVGSTTCANNSFHVRSFSCFSHDAKSVSREDWASLLQKFPLLRVLNLGMEEVHKLPSEATQHLSHLRYVKVRAGFTESVFKLRNLQTIDLRTSLLGELPKDIWKMQQLRHLYMDGPNRLPQADESDDQDGFCLPSLQTLYYISVDPDDEISKKAPNLKKLGLYEYEYFSGEDEGSTFNLPQLQSLKFVGKCAFEVPIKFPITITKITVKKAHLDPQVISMFGDLPYLQILKLVKTSFDDDHLVFGKGSFPQLQLLKFEESNLVSWTVEKGAIQKLRRLVVVKCSLLREPQPALLHELTSLEELELIWTSLTFVMQLNDEAREQKEKTLKIKIYPPIQPATKS